MMERGRQSDASLRSSTSGAYIEIVGGRMDLPPLLAFAQKHLGETYGETPTAD